MRDEDGRDALQELRDGAQEVQEEDLQGGHRHHPAHQDDARVQERHQAELRHQVGDRRQRQPGQSCRDQMSCFLLSFLLLF